MSDSLIAFNKPYGVICQFSAHEKHPTLKQYVDEPNFYPAGRLDTDSEGLLLLTNDGALQAKIAAPKFKQPKTYWAQVEGALTPKDIEPLMHGVELSDFKALPAKAKIIHEPEQLWERVPPIRERKSIPTTWLELTIKEGKNRQVRRMCAAIGFPCLRLVRVQIGQINLFDESLALGEWKYIPDSIF